MNRVIGFLFFLWYVFSYFITTFFVVLSAAFFAVVVSRLNQEKALDAVWAIGRFWGRALYWLTFSPVTVVGEENIPKDQAVMVLSNHTASFDIMAGIGYYPIRVLFFSKKEIFNFPLFGDVMRFMKFISVDRENPKRAAAALLEAVRKIRKGNNILLYPEGTRNKKFGEILDFKPGLNIVARQANVPIVPIIIYGNDILKPRDKKYCIVPTPVTIEILPAIFPDHPFHPVHEGNGVEEEQVLNFFTELFREKTKGHYEKLREQKAV